MSKVFKKRPILDESLKSLGEEASRYTLLKRRCGRVLLESFGSFSCVFSTSLVLLLGVFSALLLVLLGVFFFDNFLSSLKEVERQAISELEEDLVNTINKPHVFLGALYALVAQDPESYFLNANTPSEAGVKLREGMARTGLNLWKREYDLTVVAGMGVVFNTGYEVYIGTVSTLEWTYGIGWYMNDSFIELVDVELGEDMATVIRGPTMEMEYVPAASRNQHVRSILAKWNSSAARWDAPFVQEGFWEDGWMTLWQPMLDDGELFASLYAETDFRSWTAALIHVNEKVEKHYPDSYMFMLDTASSQVFGYSKQVDSAWNGAKFFPAGEHAVENIRKSYAKIQHLIDREFVQNSNSSVSTLGHRVVEISQIIHVIQIRDNHGLNAVAVAVLPLRKLYVVLIVPFVITCITTAVFMCIFYANNMAALACFLVPLTRITNQMAMVGEMELRQVAENVKLPKRFLAFTELRRIHEQFSLMVEKLKMFGKFLPSVVLKRSMLDGSDLFSDETSTNGSCNSGGSTGSNQSLTSNESLEDSYKCKDEGEDVEEQDCGKKCEMSSDDSVDLNESICSQALRFRLSLGVRQLRFVVAKVFFPNYFAKEHPRPYERISEILDSIERYRVVVYETKPRYCTFLWNTLNCIPRAFRLLIHLDNMFNKDMEHPELFFSIAQSLCWVGNIGNDEYHFYSCTGKAFDQVEKIHKVGRKLKCAMVMDGSVAEMEFSHGKFEKRCISIQDDVWQLGEEIRIDMDEWMYEMEQKEKFERWDDYNKAVAMYQCGQVQESVALMRAVVENSENDEIPNHVLRHEMMAKEE